MRDIIHFFRKSESAAGNQCPQKLARPANISISADIRVLAESRKEGEEPMSDSVPAENEATVSGSVDFSTSLASSIETWARVRTA